MNGPPRMDETLAAEYAAALIRNQIPAHSLSRYSFATTHDDDVVMICMRDGCEWDVTPSLADNDLLQFVNLAIEHNREAHNGPTKAQAPVQDQRASLGGHTDL